MSEAGFLLCEKFPKLGRFKDNKNIFAAATA
jgi:hypothetical protein